MVAVTNRAGWVDPRELDLIQRAIDSITHTGVREVALMPLGELLNRTGGGHPNAGAEMIVDGPLRGVMNVGIEHGVVARPVPLSYADWVRPALAPYIDRPMTDAELSALAATFPGLTTPEQYEQILRENARIVIRDIIAHEASHLLYGRAEGSPEMQESQIQLRRAIDAATQGM